MKPSQLRAQYGRATRILTTILAAALLTAAAAQLAMWALEVETGEMR